MFHTLVIIEGDKEKFFVGKVVIIENSHLLSLFSHLYKATQKRIAEANEARMAVVDDEFLDLINDAFTEDVAPRAEVDKAYWEGVEYGHKDGAALVAREIFEEIYRSVASKVPMEIQPIFKDDRDFDVGFINGKRDALLDVLVLASELKKKYAEGEK